MKKLLILLLFIPLVFACSSGDDDSTDDSSNGSLREFLESNIFLYQSVAVENNDALFDFFIEYPFDDVSISRQYKMTTESVTNTCFQDEYNYNECFVCSPIWMEGSITEETDNKIIWESNNQYIIEFTRLDNQTINLKHINGTTGNVWTEVEQSVTTYEYFNQRLDAINYLNCPCNSTCN